MGNLLCCFKTRRKKKIVLLLLGLDNAGKTVAAKGLAGEPHEGVVPTVGFSVVRLTYLDYKVIIYDLGGGPGIRGIWTKYFVDAHGVIFVVDSSDLSRLDEAKMTLCNILSHEKISGKPVLLLANKQDNENALDEIDIIEELNVESLVNSQKCPTLVESCSATEMGSHTRLDPGIKKGYEWLLNYIDKNYNQLNSRVSCDVKAQDEIDKTLMAEKIARLKAMELVEQRKKEEDAIESYSDYARKLDQETQTNSRQNSSEEQYEKASSSVESFPPIYHVQEQSDRPKSAREIVKDQLQIKEITKKSFPVRHHKTAPINFFPVRRIKSANERRTTSMMYRRHLKSADTHRNFKSMGDSVTVDVDLPNTVLVGPGGDDYPREIFHMNNINKSTARHNISLKDTKSEVPWLHRTINGDIGISVIDVE